MVQISNVHEREFPVPAEEIGRLLDRAGATDDPLWPSPTWPPMRFDRPLGVGASGGHGSIRYRVTGYEPGRRVEFTFVAPTGIVGTHVLEVEPTGPDTSVLRHRLAGRLTGSMRLLWPLLVRTLHDTVLEHLLDNAEHALTGAVRSPYRYPLRARLAAASETCRVRAVPVPPEARLLHAWPGRRDLADAYAVRMPPGTSVLPLEWVDAVFQDPPAPVLALMRLRNRLVPLLGIERGDRSAFAPLRQTTNEVLLGTDAPHLDFRASVLVEPDGGGTTVTVATTAAVRTGARRIYLAVVKLVHPAVVRAMLRRAARRATAPGAVRRSATRG
ncbi:DUF2867 domain-containing protein [Krasilnikovia sp. MM14-A1259]|uniref:DUF2867 domain-containing protein n=1 Tax=Krasilnikovia sp. MM14-A1259 TaxID=3373539 RepID=UPI00382241A2